jgi:hypothetical protein
MGAACVATQNIETPPFMCAKGETHQADRVPFRPVLIALRYS